MKNPAIMRITIVLNRVPTIKPRNVPSADPSACLGFLLAIISPRNAPMKGPRMIPKKPSTKIPTVNPRKAPKTPNLLARYFLAPNIGAAKSRTNVSTVKMKKTTTVAIDILSKPVPNA